MASIIIISSGSAYQITLSVKSTSGIDRQEDDQKQTKELRREHPSGWFFLTQHDAVPILADALLDLPPNREFNKTEFAEHAGVTRQTVGNYTDLLLEVELIEEIPNTSPRRYRVADDDVVRELFELNSAVNSLGE